MNVLISLWQRFKQQVAIRREMALPGLLMLVFVLLMHWIGLLQVQEWMAFDALSRRCPTSSSESSIVIVGIDEVALTKVGGFPIFDQTLVDLLTILQKSSPAVIGLNLFRNMPVQPGHAALMQILSQSQNVVGIEMALNPVSSLNIAAPPALAPEQVGFVDAVLDGDGKLRRMLLESPVAGQKSLKYSFALQLTRLYLAAHQISFRPDIRPDGSIQFETFNLHHSRTYGHPQVSSNQILLNFCANQRLFQTLSLTDVLEENFDPNSVRNRIVIVGMTAPSVKDVFFTSALRETLSSRLINKPLPATQLLYGVEVQAHATHQMISAVSGQQPQLQVWGWGWDYGWVIGWGLLGITLEILLQSPWKSLLSFGVATAVLIGICFFVLTLGWWIPLVPAGLALIGAGVVTTFFDRDLRFELEYRRAAVERTYEAVHNGPLQHLAVILRSLDGNNSSEQLQDQLYQLNEELRSIFEHMRQSMLTYSDRLYLKEDLVLDLQAPISELLYQVYNYTLERQVPGFTEIQTYISPDFELLKRNSFSIEQKRGLCLFLQEALLNVGNHALGATRLDVMCLRQASNYVLRITDNGSGIEFAHKGQGTKQAKLLAWELGGRFQRRANSPQGTICELIFPMRRSWGRRLRQMR